MKRGFTLLEILVSIAILSFLTGAIIALLNIANKAYHEDMGLLDLKQQAHQAMQGMIREIRQSRASDIIINNPGPSSGSVIRFTHPDSPNCFRYSLTSNQILRQILDCSTLAQLAQVILAGNINSLNFSLASNSIVITFDSQKPVLGRALCFPAPCSPTQFLTETVKLRN